MDLLWAGQILLAVQLLGSFGGCLFWDVAPTAFLLPGWVCGAHLSTRHCHPGQCFQELTVCQGTDIFVVVVCSESGSHCATQASLERVGLLPQPPECWDYRWAPMRPAEGQTLETGLPGLIIHICKQSSGDLSPLGMTHD
jgi:hypothetical protein